MAEGEIGIVPASEQWAYRVLEAYEWLFAPPGSVPAGWDPERARSALSAAIASPDAEILIAARGRELLGFCSAYVDLESVRFGRRCWVEDLAVAPQARSHGIGAALLDAAGEWGAARGATHLELDSGEARHDAHRFYERRQPAWRSQQYSWRLER